MNRDSKRAPNKLLLVTIDERLDLWRNLIPMFDQVKTLSVNDTSALPGQIAHLLKHYVEGYLVFLDVPKDVLVINNTLLIKMYNIYRMIESTSMEFAREYVSLLKVLSDNNVKFEMDPFLHKAMSITMYPKSGLSRLHLTLTETKAQSGDKYIIAESDIFHSKMSPGTNNIKIAYTEHHLPYEDMQSYSQDLIEVLRKDYILLNIDSFETEGVYPSPFENMLMVDRNGQKRQVIKINTDRPNYNPGFYAKLIEKELKI